MGFLLVNQLLATPDLTLPEDEKGRVVVRLLMKELRVS